MKRFTALNWFESPSNADDLGKCARSSAFDGDSNQCPSIMSSGRHCRVESFDVFEMFAEYLFVKLLK